MSLIIERIYNKFINCKYVEGLQAKKYSELGQIHPYKRHNKIIIASSLAMADPKIQKIAIKIIESIYSSNDIQLKEKYSD